MSADKLTIGQAYDPMFAAGVTDEQIRERFEFLVQRQVTKFGMTREKAEELERSNVGYYAGYCGMAGQERVERVLSAVHPIFGSVAKKPPTGAEA